ncbi:MAG: NADH-quinone oxidoreductase subunit L [Betaproteobacteria bacterium]|nr:MAG: NADH-quinone oxidoreductase subunit L [Betaproteobacteria bacterium]
MTDLQLCLLVPLAPLAGAIVAGLGGRRIGRSGAHWVTIIGVAISFAASCLIFVDVLDGAVFNGPVYTWLVSDGTRFEIGFLIDRLSALMMVVVSFVSLMVHVYTIGYMADDPGYQRFFAYIALFTFSMLMLVMANNFLQLFFGWEAVGLVSYLLIGFWYTRPSAIYANLKAFLVNRVGDFGFLLAIALVLAYFGTLDYAAVFSRAPAMAGTTIEVVPGAPWLLLSAICIGLFIGAMGKSAQFPLHVWLPDSMEGPTPISALIHAATMVTAGIFMVARMSPLFELSQTALALMLVVGGITAFFMALIAVVQYDIKRVVAYSTLSQLGYMTVALGASAYSAAIFHLMTHAFFKALLFLGAGSVIIALHHEQDMRRMGGLWKHMPWTYGTVLIGAIASVGVPGFAGFFSKDAIIEAVHLSKTPGAGFAWLAVTACVFVTAFYTFRLVFYAFHGKERFESHDHAPHESPAVVTVPLVLLAIPSICAGWLIGPVLFGDYFGGSIAIAPSHPGLREMAEEFHGVLPMMAHAVRTIPFWLTAAGIAAAWYLYILKPELHARLRKKAGVLVTVLEEKYGFDRFYDWFFAGGARRFGNGLWRFGDVTVIDGLMVNGSASLIGWFAGLVRLVQSGFIYHYAFFMIIGVSMLLTYFIFFRGTLVP